MPKKPNYTDYSKDELIDKITELEQRKKYGLVWNEKKEVEKVVLDCKKQFPVLKEVKSKAIKNDPEKPTHILIEGDNYHALSVLNYTHQNAIDVIYIDPPFNTGSRSWKYNNDYVDKEDSFKHSKFISFMNNRLRLSKSLLKDDGIIIVAIDDYEIHTVRFLMDEIFQENNRLGSVTVVHNPRGRNDDKFFATSHEYMLVYAKDSEKAFVGNFKLSEEDKEKYNIEDDISRYNLTSFIRTGNNSDRNTRPNLFYPIYYNVDTYSLSLEKTQGSQKLLPINNHGDEKTWRWGQETFVEKHQTELFVKEVKGQNRIFKKRRLLGQGKRPKTIWYDSKYDASSNGIMVLRDILGRGDHFPYPKSVYLVKDILEITSKKDSIILDYFAGSGTTAHAVMLLNQEDGGLRQSIVCTNNENNICDDVCYPRIKNIAIGYNSLKGKEIKGSNENLQFFKTTFVPAKSTDQNKEKLTKQSVEMLCLKENTFESVFDSDIIKIFKNNDHYTGILFDEEEISNFKEQIKDYDLPVSVYVFSLGDDDFAEEFSDIKDKVKVCSIPAAILRVYKRIFR